MHLAINAKKLINLIKNKVFNQMTTYNPPPAFEGLSVENVGENNLITIDPECKFARSKIIVSGNNNTVKLGPTLAYNQLTINLKGDNKLVTIERSNKFIQNFKLTSTRGNNQKVQIGENLSCGGIEVQMNDGDEAFTIGNNCLFSWGIKARTSDGHSIIDLETNEPINFPQDITISDRVWICEDVRLMKGTFIPEECVVGAASLLTKRYDEGNSVIAGVPAKIVRKNVKWNHRQPSKYNV